MVGVKVAVGLGVMGVTVGVGLAVGVADENNVLKLGSDVRDRRWPAWMDALGVRRGLLPEVVAPPAFPAGAVRGQLAKGS